MHELSVLSDRLKCSSELEEVKVPQTADKRSAAIFRTFKCQDIDMLLRAYTVYVRPLVDTILLFRHLSLLKISRPLSLFNGVSQSDYLVSVILHTMNV